MANTREFKAKEKTISFLEFCRRVRWVEEDFWMLWIKCWVWMMFDWRVESRLDIAACSSIIVLLKKKYFELTNLSVG